MNRFFLVMLIAGGVFGQTAANGPRFDAVSIHPSAPEARGGGFNLSPGRLNAKNQSLKDLVEFAWDLHDYQVSGGLGWIGADRYEIVAIFPGATTNAQRALMMQAMLAERFGLTVRKESKEVSGYGLVIGKNGPKLHAAAGGDPGMMMGRSRTSGLRTLTGTGAKMSNLASILADMLSRPVEDKTSLVGVFDFSMEWLPDSMAEGARVTGGKETIAAENQSGPSIFSALQETLGLKLETAKVRVDTVVIERAEKPSEN